MKLFEGETYTLRIERESGGYVYGPWETHFKVEEEKKRKRRKAKEERESVADLEGEFDVLTELERAQLGKASLYEKYHFLAILDGYMFYTIKVFGKGDLAVENAAVIVNGKEEGKSDDKGIYVVKYSGDARRFENIQIVKKGEHKWMNDIEIYPNAEITIELNKMLLIDVFAFTEYYDTIEGIKNVKVYLGEDYIGKTDSEGALSHKYINERGVDGYLELSILFPQGFLPQRLKNSFLITKDLPILSLSQFAYTENVVPPKVALIPLIVKNGEDPFLKRNTQSLETQIRDFLSLGGAFTLVSGKTVQQLFDQFELNLGRGDLRWKDIPLIKKEVDAIIFGEISGGKSRLTIKLKGVDYTGEVISSVNRRISLRELQYVSENFVAEFKNSFPYEGNIISIDEKVYMNLGRRHAVRQGHRFYGVYHYYDEIIKDYSKKRVAKLKVVEAGPKISAVEVETLSEGFLLEPGLKVIVYIHDLFGKNRSLALSEVMREPYFVPERKNINELYRELYEHDIPIVFAVDEHGGITGMGTIYDIGEEIIGKISSFESKKNLIVKIHEGEYLCDGEVEIDEIDALLSIDIVPEDFTTLNGLILSILKRIPNKGDYIDIDRFRFIVEKASKKRAELIRIVSRPIAPLTT